MGQKIPKIDFIRTGQNWKECLSTSVKMTEMRLAQTVRTGDHVSERHLLQEWFTCTIRTSYVETKPLFREQTSSQAVVTHTFIPSLEKPNQPTNQTPPPKKNQTSLWMKIRFSGTVLESSDKIPALTHTDF